MSRRIRVRSRRLSFRRLGGFRSFVVLRREVVGDGVGDFFLEAGDRLAGLFRRRNQDVIGMPPVLVDVNFGTDTGLLQVSDVGHGFIVERLDIADKGIAGRQAAVVLAAGGRRVAGDEVRTVRVPEVALPGFVVPFRVPVFGVVVSGGRRVPVVQHRIKRHMESDVDFFPVPREHAQGGCHTAAGAFSSDHDLVRAHAQFLRVVPQPEQGGVAVVQGCRIGIALGQTVFRRDQHHAEFFHKGQRAGEKDNFGGAGLVAAAVDPQDAGNLFLALVLRREDQQADRVNAQFDFVVPDFKLVLFLLFILANFYGFSRYSKTYSYPCSC